MDYLVKLQAQDNITSVLDKVRNELKQTGAAGSHLDRIIQKFQDITQSSAPLQRKLKSVQQLISEMNFRGLDNTAAYEAMIQQAGNYRDAISDARDAVRAFASDHANLDAAVSAIQGVTAAGTICTGVMGLFGQENENVQQAILKVQSALAILNGVQTLANVLNSRSILILKLKQLATVGATVTTASFTTALSAATLAQTFATLKTKIDTAAQWAWNTAKAIGLAMLGNWKGVALLAAGGIIATTMALKDDTDEQKNNNDIKEKGLQIQNEYIKRQSEIKQKVVEACGASVSAYQGLRFQWNQLKSDLEKTKFLDDNKDKFQKLGFSVTDVSTAEELFNRKTGIVVDALVKRARAAAMYEVYLGELKKLYELQNTPLSYKWNYDGDKGGKSWTENKAAAKEAATTERRQRLDQQMKLVSRIENQMVAANRELDAANQQVAKFNTNVSKSSGGGASKASHSGGQKFESGSLKALEAQKQQIENLKQTKKLTDAQVASYNNQLRQINAQIAAEKERLSVTDAEENSLTDLEDKVKSYRDMLSRNNYPRSEINIMLEEIDALNEKIKLKKIEIGLEEPDRVASSLELLKNEKTYLEQCRQTRDYSTEEAAILNQQIADTEALIKKEEERLGIRNRIPENSLQGLDTKIEDTRVKLSCTVAGTEEAIELQNILKQLEEKRHVIEVAIEKGTTEDVAEDMVSFEKKSAKAQETAEKWQTVAQQSGQAFSALGGAIQGTSGQIISMVGQSIAAIGELIPQIMALCLAKEAEALSEGTASAAGTGYPQCLVAIATIVATIMGLFSSWMGNFASGGIIGGSSMHGDKLFASVNSGEMILNQTQQGKLWRLINGGAGQSAGTINFKIKGSDLVGTINNYNSKISKFT